jgi:hypothetical protein
MTVFAASIMVGSCVAEIDADPEGDALVLGHLGIAVDQDQGAPRPHRQDHREGASLGHRRCNETAGLAFRRADWPSPLGNDNGRSFTGHAHREAVGRYAGGPTRRPTLLTILNWEKHRYWHFFCRRPTRMSPDGVREVGRAGRHVWRKRSRPTARRCRPGRAIGCSALGR